MIKRPTTRLVSSSLSIVLALSFSLYAGEMEDQANQIL